MIGCDTGACELNFTGSNCVGSVRFRTGADRQQSIPSCAVYPFYFQTSKCDQSFTHHGLICTLLSRGYCLVPAFCKVKRESSAKITPCKQPVRLLVSASLNQPANSVFLSQKISISQPKSAPTPTSEQTQNQRLHKKREAKIKDRLCLLKLRPHPKQLHMMTKLPI